MPERNLDELRAIAVLCVLLAHVGNMLYPGTGQIRPPELGPYVMLGRAGVLIFFVHTSYVLMGSLDRMRAQGLSGGSLAKQFYVRRVFRIYPLAIATIVVVRLAHLPVRPEPWSFFRPAGRFILLSNLALVQNLTNTPNLLLPMWSLPIEVQMYVLLPLLAWGLRKSSSIGMIAFWIGAVLLALIPLFGPSGLAHRLELLHFAPCFAAGAIAYHLSSRIPPRIPSRVWLPFLVGLLAVFAFVPQLRMAETIGSPQLGWEWILTALVAFGLVLVREVASSRLAVAAHVIATYSYGIYLTHVPVLAALVRVWPDTHNPLWWLVVLAGIAAASWSAYTFIEVPGIRLGQHFTRGRTNAATLAPAP